MCEQINRHGDRNILGPAFPRNPYQSEKHWKGGFGQLTRTGKVQAFELGTFLRKRYKKLIGKSYSSGHVYCRSTDRSRTIMTAQCCLTGLFSKARVKNRYMKCHPFKVHKKYDRKDFLLNPSAKCKWHKKLKNDFLKSREVKRLWWKHHSLIESIEKNTGRKMRSLRDIADVQDTLFIEHLKGYR